MAEFKYKDEISSFSCDLLDFTEYENRIAFRFVFEDINDERNFLPVYKLDETRPRSTCRGWALSFFESQEKAKDKMKEMSKNKPFISKKLGTHVAEGVLVKVDGVSCTSSEKGHFDHFEYVEIVLNHKFTIVSESL